MSLRYWCPIETEKFTASLDMVRYVLHFKSASFDSNADAILVHAPKDSDYYRARTRKPGACVSLWRFPFGDDSAVIVGLGMVEGTGKVNERRGFLEFNPNKVASDELFGKFWGDVRGLLCKSSLVRFDAAFDYPVDRSKCHLVQDKRGYEMYRRGTLTEYLGCRNSPGRVKLYDKQAESGLDFPLTRLELTCDANWDDSFYRNKWPVVVTFSDFGNSKNGKLAVDVYMMWQLCFLHGHRFEEYLHLYTSSRTRARLKSAVEQACSMFEFPDGVFASLRLNAAAFEV